MSREMGICNSLPMWIAVAFLAAHIIADVHCAPPKLNPEQIGMIRANVLEQLGMTEPLPPLTPDQVKLAEALRNYHTASKVRRGTDSSQQRLKRQEEEPGTEFCEQNQTTCCLHSLELNFHEDLGLYHIILPETITANYCLGNCTLDLSPAVFTLYSLLSPNNTASSIEPCCATRSTSGTSILYHDGPTIVAETIEGTTVTACGCM